jgi:iron complex outermembrane receptor protein
VTYQATRNIFLFGTYSKGYRAGAYSPTPGRGASPAPGAAPEKVDNYELGFKGDLFDRHLRLNIAGYYEKYRDLQVRNTIALGQVAIENAGSATIYGVEGEATAILGGGFAIDGTLGLLHARYDSLLEQITPTVVLDRAGNRLIRAPSRQFSITGRFETDLSASQKLRANLTYFNESKSFYTAGNEIGLGNDGWHTLDARLALQNRSGLEIFAFGKNLTDKRYYTNVLPILGYAASLNPGRRYGIGAKYQF